MRRSSGLVSALTEIGKVSRAWALRETLLADARGRTSLPLSAYRAQRPDPDAR